MSGMLFDAPRVPEVERGARFSECGAYRYYLSRHWARYGEVQLFVMLNPSIADANIDDPTIRRCMGFARRDGYAGIGVLNLYGLRATDPRGLALVDDPVGPDNDAYLQLSLTERVRRGLPVIAAWGVHGASERVSRVLGLVGDVDWRCLGRTKAGAPRHPLYVRGDHPLEPFGEAA